MEETIRGAQELFIKMSGSNLVKSLQHLLSGITVKSHSFSLCVQPAIGQEIHPLMTFIYSSRPVWDGEEKGIFGNQLVVNSP